MKHLSIKTFASLFCLLATISTHPASANETIHKPKMTSINNTKHDVLPTNECLKTCNAECDCSQCNGDCQSCIDGGLCGW